MYQKFLTGDVQEIYGRCLSNISRAFCPLSIDVPSVLREMLPFFVRETACCYERNGLSLLKLRPFGSFARSKPIDYRGQTYRKIRSFKNLHIYLVFSSLICIFSNITSLSGLSKGVYIINGKKVLVKLLIIHYYTRPVLKVRAAFLLYMRF